MERHQDHQLCLVDRERDYVVAAANTVPLYTPNPYDLPETGWDWILKTAYETMDREPNVLCGIAISVSSTWRGKGIARIMIEAMRDLCVESSEEHTSELQSLLRISYDVFYLINKNYYFLTLTTFSLTM